MVNENAQLAKVIYEMQQRIKTLERAQFLRNASIDDGALQVKDAGGSLRQVIGAQPDGTFTTVDVNGPPPPAPTVPGVFEAPGGLRVYWDGTFPGAVAPLNFRRVTVHAIPMLQFDPALFNPLDQTLIVGTLEHATGGEVTAALPAKVEHAVVLVAWNQSGRFSAASEPGLGTPVQVRARDGAAPTASPIPTVKSGIGALHVSWEPSSNNDPLTYEVHVHEGAGDFTPTAETLVEKTAGSSLTIREMPDGSPVTPGENVRRNLFAPFVDTGMNTSIDGIESNTAFGAYTPPPTWALSGEVVDEQPASLKVTWRAPDAAAGVGQWVNVGNIPLEAGVSYTASARVFVPAGNPDVFIDAVFMNRSAAVTVKDEWVTVSTTFIATGNGVFIGVGTSAPVAGGVVYLEKWLLEKGTTAGPWFPGAELSQQYAVRIVAFDDDGRAPAGLAAVGRATQAQQHEVSADVAYFGDVSVGQLRSGTMNADVVIGGRWATATSGERVESSSAGIAAYDSAGNARTRINTDGTIDATGTASLTTATVEEQLSVRGELEITRGAKAVLSTGVTTPTQAPAVVVSTNSFPINYANPPGETWQIKSVRYIAVDSETYAYLGVLVPGSQAGGTDQHRIYRFRVDTGAADPGTLVDETLLISKEEPSTKVFLGAWPLLLSTGIVDVIMVATYHKTGVIQIDLHEPDGGPSYSTFNITVTGARDVTRPPAVFCDSDDFWAAWTNTAGQVVMRRYNSASDWSLDLMPDFSTTHTNDGQYYPNNSTPYGGNVRAATLVVNNQPVGVLLEWQTNTGTGKDDPVGVYHNTYINVDPNKTYELNYEFAWTGSTSVPIVGPYVEVFFYTSSNTLLGSIRLNTTWSSTPSQYVDSWHEFTPGAHYSNATKIRIGFALNPRSYTNDGRWTYIRLWQMGGWTNYASQTIISALGTDNVPLALCRSNGVNDLNGVDGTVHLIRTATKIYALNASGAPLGGGVVDAYAWNVPAAAGKPFDWSPAQNAYVYPVSDSGAARLAHFNSHAAMGPNLINYWYFQYTWFNTINGYETAGSPWSSRFTAARRSWLSITSGAPLNLGLGDDPDQIRVYSAATPSRTAGHLMGVSVEPAAATYRRLHELNPASTGPASPDPLALPAPFPDSTPASWETEATDAHGPKGRVAGSGESRFGNLLIAADGTVSDLTDTDWISSAPVSSALSGTVAYRRFRGCLQVRFNATVTTAITVDTSGGITDQSLVVLPAGFRPGGAGLSTVAVFMAYDANQIPVNVAIYNGGTVALGSADARAVAYTFPVNTNFTGISALYPIQS